MIRSWEFSSGFGAYEVEARLAPSSVAFIGIAIQTAISDPMPVMPDPDAPPPEETDDDPGAPEPDPGPAPGPDPTIVYPEPADNGPLGTP